MFRDDRVASHERIRVLEDELSQLRAPTSLGAETPPLRWRRVVAAGFALAVLGVVATFFLGRPYSKTVLQYNDGHMLSVAFWVPVHEVHWERADDQGPVVPFTVPATDLSGAALGSRAATAMLPPSVVNQDGETKLLLSYRALGFKRTAMVNFDVNQSNIDFGKKSLSGLTPLVAFSGNHDETHVIFTTLLVYKPCLSEIRWGVGDEPLDQRVRFAPSTRLGVDTSDEMLATVPGQIHHVRVQLVFKDGSRSPVRTILRTDGLVR